MTALAAVARGAQAVRWYVGEMMGDSAYDTYVRHLRQAHPDTSVPTEREFWKEKMADQDRNPGARCC